MNERHCMAKPVYGFDLIDAVCLNGINTSDCRRFVGGLAHQVKRTQLTTCLCNAIKLPKQRLMERKGVTERYMVFAVNYSMFWNWFFLPICNSNELIKSQIPISCKN